MFFKTVLFLLTKVIFSILIVTVHVIKTNQPDGSTALLMYTGWAILQDSSDVFLSTILSAL